LAGGIQLDENEEWKDAVRYYSKAMEYLLAGTSYDRLRTRREKKLQLLKHVMERAETIQKILQNTTTNKTPVSPTNASKSPPTPTPNASTSNQQQKPFQKPNNTNNNNKPQSAEVERLRQSLSDAVVTERPNVRWDDVAGLENAKKALDEAIVLPRKYPQLFVGKRQPWKAILLYGPPGTGKSLLAKAAASNMDETATFYSVSSSDLISKYQGESEKLVRNLFEMAAETAPSVIFIDEIDAICSKRGSGPDENESSRRVKNELLIKMQDCPKGVFVLGATNRPYSLDAALRRRFDKRIYIPLPEEASREQIMKIHMGDEPSKLKNQDYKKLAQMSEGYSPADLSIVVRDALMQPIRQALRAKTFKRTPSGNHLVACDESEQDSIEMSLFDIKDPTSLRISDLTLENFEQSFARIRPSVSAHDVADAERFTAEFGEGELGAKAKNSYDYSHAKMNSKPSSSSSVSHEELGNSSVVTAPKFRTLA